MRIHLQWVVKLHAQIQHILVILQLIYVLLYVLLILIIIHRAGNVRRVALEDISQIGKLIELASLSAQVAQSHFMEPLLSDASKLPNVVQDHLETTTLKNAAHALAPCHLVIQSSSNAFVIAQ